MREDYEGRTGAAVGCEGWPWWGVGVAAVQCGPLWGTDEGWLQVEIIRGSHKGKSACP